MSTFAGSRDQKRGRKAEAEQNITPVESGMVKMHSRMQGHLSLAAVSAITLYLCCLHVPQSIAWNAGSAVLQRPVGLRTSFMPTLRRGNAVDGMTSSRFPSPARLRMAISDEARISTSGGAGGFFT